MKNGMAVKRNQLKTGKHHLKEELWLPVLKSETGMALVLTLLILVLITTMVVEFSYGVYTASSSFSNWKESQRLSLIASSGVSLAVKTVSENTELQPYTYPGRIDVPVPRTLSGLEGDLLISVEDENARFNLNSLVWPNGLDNEKAFSSFRRLLRHLSLDERIAEKVGDWIDRDSEPRTIGSEDAVKNSYVDSADELFLLKGVDRQHVNVLFPYVTAYGPGRIDADLVNINTASIPVIMSLDERLTRELAERIVAFRDLSPFEKTSDIVKVAGFEEILGQSLMGRIIVKSSNFRIISTAEASGIKRVIEAVVEITGNQRMVKYWREM